MEILNDSFIFKTRIDIGDTGDYIVLRELNMQEVGGLRKDESVDAVEKNLKHLENVFKDCLIEHSFTKNGEIATKQDVYNEFKKSGTLFMEILSTWLGSLPFSKRLKKKKSEV